MRKQLLLGVAIVNAVMFAISLAYAGFRVGYTFRNYHGTDFSFLLYSVVYFILFLVGCAQVKWHSFPSEKSYYIFGFTTLAFISVFWGKLLICEWDNLQIGVPDTIVLDIIIYPAVLFALSFINCMLYVICAVIAKKETKITFTDTAN